LFVKHGFLLWLMSGCVPASILFSFCRFRTVEMI